MEALDCQMHAQQVPPLARWYPEFLTEVQKVGRTVDQRVGRMVGQRAGQMVGQRAGQMVDQRVGWMEVLPMDREEARLASRAEEQPVFLLLHSLA